MKYFADVIRNAKPVYGNDAVMKAFNTVGDVRIEYRDQPDFDRIARQFGIFEEWKVLLVSFPHLQLQWEWILDDFWKKLFEVKAIVFKIFKKLHLIR